MDFLNQHLSLESNPFWVTIVLGIIMLYFTLVSIPSVYISSIKLIYLIYSIIDFFNRLYHLILNKEITSRHQSVKEIEENQRLVNGFQYFFSFWIKAINIGFLVLMVVILTIVTIAYYFFIYPMDQDYMLLKTFLLSPPKNWS